MPLGFVQGSSWSSFGLVGTNYCGPNYTGGTLLGPGENGDFSVPANGPVDGACKVHDQAYGDANNSATPAADRLAADLKLINDVSNLLNEGNLTQTETAQAAAIAAAFIPKVNLWDIPAAVVEAAQGLLKKLFDDFGLTPLSIDVDGDFFLPDEPADISQDVNDDYAAARAWIFRDPLAIDLDNDGIETVGIEGGVLFDHNADGIRTGTGWVKADDALVVLDRDGNGSIDSGRELFGVDYLKTNGQQAANGFDALADLDGNADGHFDATDAQYASVRLWRDLNQDGVSQGNQRGQSHLKF